MLIKGTWTALITPFRNGSVHIQTLQRLIDAQEKAGIDGLVLLGTTAEAFSLSDNERELIIKTARHQVGNRLGLFVGCGTSSTMSTLQNARQARDFGADGLMIVTPPYVKPNPLGLKEHISRICSAVDLPVMIYNNPGRCGSNMGVEFMLELCQLANVIAVKESGDNLQQICQLIYEKPERIQIFAGDDSLIFPMLCFGAAGAVSVCSNLFPQRIKGFIDALLSENLQKARQLLTPFFPLFKALSFETNPIAIKYLMHHLKLCKPDVRCPLGDIDSRAKLQIDAMLPDIFFKS